VKTIDLTGKQFGRLTVIGKSANRHGRLYWSCVCDCGKSKAIAGRHLSSGATQSCGCLKATNPSNRKHGLTGTKTYRAYVHMIDRCYNKRDKSYKHYGGRGIAVCDRWKESILHFVEDMGLSPEGLTLDRINCDGDYEPENCRWATQKVQQNNRRNNVVINGKPLAEYDMAKSTFYRRCKKGMTPEQAISEPKKGSPKLNQIAVNVIRHLFEKGVSNARLAKAYGLSRKTIWEVTSGRSWMGVNNVI